MKIFTKNKTVLALTMALATIGALNNAIAQESVNGEKNVINISNNSKSTNIVHIGTPVVSAPLKGFSKLPLISVLHQITPNGWVVKKNRNSVGDLDLQQIVSWEGGSNWYETLNKIAAEKNLEATINWNTKEIILSVLTPIKIEKSVVTITPISKKGVFELDTEITKGGSQQLLPTKVATKPIASVVVPPPIVVWKIKSGMSLKANVIEMAKIANYTVEWMGKDYPVDDSRILSGDFDGEVGPIKQLSIDYGVTSRVEQPLSFVFYQNNKLVVEDYKFEQSGATQHIHQ